MILSSLNRCVMRCLGSILCDCTVLSSMGVETVSTSRVVIAIFDHDDLAARIKLRREQRREPNRAGADDRHRRAWLDLAVEHTAFEARRQNIAKHDERVFVAARRDAIEAGVGKIGCEHIPLGFRRSCCRGSARH